ncbi:MAG: ATP synthase F1 subunit delta [Bdellovibrionales bacterium]|nr:ATP synthase F1 subunit delta [Bdellovibrionales bacterium]
MANFGEAIAKKYAKALFESFEASDLDNLENALTEFCKIWESHEGLVARLMSPSVLQSEKASALQDIGEMIARATNLKAGDRFSRFLVLVLENGRMAHVREIFEAYSSLLRQVRKELTIQITTAAEVSEDERRAVGERVQGESSKQGVSSLSSIEWYVDSELIGGAIIQCGDKTIDGSVRGALEGARSALVHR